VAIANAIFPTHAAVRVGKFALFFEYGKRPKPGNNSKRTFTTCRYTDHAVFTVNFVSHLVVSLPTIG